MSETTPAQYCTYTNFMGSEKEIARIREALVEVDRETVFDLTRIYPEPPIFNFFIEEPTIISDEVWPREKFNSLDDALAYYSTHAMVVDDGASTHAGDDDYFPAKQRIIQRQNIPAHLHQIIRKEYGVTTQAQWRQNYWGTQSNPYDVTVHLRHPNAICLTYTTESGAPLALLSAIKYRNDDLHIVSGTLRQPDENSEIDATTLHNPEHDRGHGKEYDQGYNWEYDITDNVIDALCITHGDRTAFLSWWEVSTRITFQSTPSPALRPYTQITVQPNNVSIATMLQKGLLYRKDGVFVPKKEQYYYM